MFVIEVIPLKKSVTVESLSYYSATEYPHGTIIEVPLRKSVISAVVIASKPVSAAKTALKTATFSLKKLRTQETTTKIPQSLIATAHTLSRSIPAHIGAIVYSLLPADIRSGVRTYPQSPEHKNEEDSIPTVLTGTKKDRYVAYRSHIRQNFAHRGSVLFVVPTSVAVDEAREHLESGIEKRVITFSSTHTKKQLDASYKTFEDLSQAKLIIATPNFAFLDRHDITTIIIEGSGSQHYVSRIRPYLDAREALKTYAKETGRSILLGDALPLTDDEVKRRDEVYGTFEEHTKRLEFNSNVEVIKHSSVNVQKDFSPLSEELIEAIKLTHTNRGRVFLHAARRGLAPIVVCYDCGHIFRCADSGAPFSLLRTMKNGEEERWFYCSTSGRRVRAADVCPDCGGWRLKEQGIGIQQVYDVVRKTFPNTEVFLFDHTTASTHAKAKRIVNGFYDAKKSILIGTNMCLPYLQKQIECTAVISYEALRSIPTWRADETIFSNIIALREITSKDTYIQTRSEPDELLTLARKGLVDQFYEGEIALRSALSYPPFVTFILLSWAGTKEQTQTIEAEIVKLLKDAEIQLYSAPQSTPKKTVRHGLLRIKKDATSHAQLIDTLRTLPPYIKIEINPPRIV